MTTVQIKEQGDKFKKAFRALQNTLSKLGKFNKDENYPDTTLELYDASGPRFTRTYECAIKLFRAKDITDSIEPASTFRDLIHKMETFGFIKQAETWANMKIIRNKLNHEYLPFDQEEIFNFVFEEAREEFDFLNQIVQ